MSTVLRSLAVHLSIPALLLAGCATTTSPVAVDAAPQSTRPRLVVLFVVDGLPQRQVTDYRDQLGPDGFRRFLDRGTWYSNAHYSHAHTVTAVGHATFLTGAPPSATGILSNEWRDPATGAAVYCTGDPAAQYIGHKTNRLDGTSPRNLRAESVGDVLRQRFPQAKVIGISSKDRGAILPAGKSGTAYMYMNQSGAFVSTTYYMKEHPSWVVAFNEAKPADRYFKQSWKALLPEDAYKRSLPDGQSWYAGPGRLPMTFGSGDAPGANFYGSIVGSPFSDELTLDFARAALAGESLGQDDVPDILSISLSGHDYVNHAYGAESRLSHDHLLHLDRALGAFFRHLDQKVGAGRYVALLSADHGFMPVPEHSLAQGKDAGRINPSQMIARVNAGLAPQFGEGAWLAGVSGNGVLLNRRLIDERKADAKRIAEAARDLLRKEAGIESAWLKTEIQNGLPAGTRFADLLRNHLIADLSPEIILVTKPLWMASSRPGGTTHGSPHDYDTHVPLLIYGRGQTGEQKMPVSVQDIAATVAAWIGLPAPAQSTGRPLPANP